MATISISCPVNFTFLASSLVKCEEDWSSIGIRIVTHVIIQILHIAEDLCCDSR